MNLLKEKAWANDRIHSFNEVKSMAEFVRDLSPDIPQVLCHYTRESNIGSMLRGDTKSVCFWLKNNRDKNDMAELQMGIELMTKVREYLKSISKSTLLDQLSDFEHIYSLSFTEGKVNSHMLKTYGPVCLELDLRGFSGGTPQKCEYCTEDDIDGFAKLYIADFNRLYYQSSIANLLLWNKAEMDVIQKIATIKRKKEWGQEEEWRIIMHRQQDDSRFITTSNGSQCLVLNIPISFLKRVILFYNNENKTKMNKTRAYLKAWKRQNDVRSFDVVMRNSTTFVGF